MRWLVVLVLILGGGLLGVVALQRQTSELGAPQFEPGSWVVIESGQDYPDEPRALHPTQLHVIDAEGGRAAYGAPGANRARPVVLTQDALLYFDHDQRAVVDAVTGTVVPETSVSEERFGGYMAATHEAQPRIAYGRTSSHGTEFTQELVVLAMQPNAQQQSTLQWTSSVAWRSTSAGPSVVVPLGWAEDNETIFFSTRDADAPASAPLHTLIQLRVPPDASASLAIQPSEVSFPSDDAELLGLSADTNTALFGTEEGEDESASAPQLLLHNLTNGETQAIPLDGPLVVQSVGFGEQTAVLFVTEAGSQESRLLLVQFGLDEPITIPIDGESGRVCSVDGTSVSVWFSQPKGMRGTWQQSLIAQDNGQDEPNTSGSKISQFECAGFASISRSNH